MEEKNHKTNYWFFTSVSKHQLEDGMFNFNFKSRRNIKIKENDKVVFLTPYQKQFVFGHVAEINSIEKEKLYDLKFSYSIAFKNVERTDRQKYLANYSYSLTRIKDFNNPIKHFNFRYGSLEEVEYKSIIKGDFFIARTKFGKYVNALPKQHKIAFIEYFIEVNADLYFNDFKDYNEALKLLEFYIESRITQPAKYMKAGYLLMSNLISKEEIKSIRFSTREKPVDKFEVQYQYCEEYLGLIDSQISHEKVLSNKNSASTQLEFNRLFRKTPWPIIID